MGIMTRQANFLLPENLLEELKKTVPKREQSRVVAEALKKELKRLKFQKALSESFGAWKNADHPELKAGAEAFIRSLRRTTRSKRS